MEQQSREAALQGMELRAAQGHLHLLKEINNRAGRFTGTGNWYYNATTHETWYQDVIFFLHGMPPQSLNANLHTFYHYIHPEDKDLVVEYIDKAFLDKSPLHIDYRILVNGKEKWLAYKSFWFYGDRGEAVLGGLYQDITEQKKADKEAEAYKALVQFQRQQALYDEQQINFGHWQVNLLTRKTVYSDQFYRIFGLKPNSLAPNISSFINYIHPEDRDKVEASYRQIIYEHAVPDLEYRIIRSDGKTRHILQKAKLLMLEQELMVSVSYRTLRYSASWRKK
jgi:PAS domain-containing protein